MSFLKLALLVIWDGMFWELNFLRFEVTFPPALQRTLSKIQFTKTKILKIK